MATITFNSLSRFEAAKIILEKQAARETVEQLFWLGTTNAVDEIFKHFSGTIQISCREEILTPKKFGVTLSRVMNVWMEHFKGCVQSSEYSQILFHSAQEITEENGCTIQFLSERGIRSIGLDRSSIRSNLSPAHIREIPKFRGMGTVFIARLETVPAKIGKMKDPIIRELIEEHKKTVKVSGIINRSFAEKFHTLLRAYKKYLKAPENQKERELAECEKLVNEYDFILEISSSAVYYKHKRPLELQIISSASVKRIQAAIEECRMPETFFIPSDVEQVRKPLNGGFTRMNLLKGREVCLEDLKTRKNVHSLEGEKRPAKASRVS